MGELLDGRRLEVVDGSEGEQCVAENAHDAWVARGLLLHLGFNGVEDALEESEGVNWEAGERMFHGNDQADRFLVVRLAECLAQGLRTAQLGVHGPSPLSPMGR